MRNRIISIAIFTALILLVFGLFYTQVIRFGHYDQLSKNNVIRIIPIDGPRGIIFDRNGVPLVTNRLAFDVAVVYQELQDLEKFVRLVSATVGISPRDIAAALERASLKPYAPVTVVEDIPKEKALILDEASFDMPGLVIETRSKRSYPYGNVGSHLFGYLSEISEDELDRLRDYGYRMRDLIGRSGLERSYNNYLAGVDGGIQVQVDNRGRQARVLGLKEPKSGQDLYTTIDISLQIVADKILAGKRGAVVAMDPRTGEVLALSSHPAFDPNVFVTANKSEERLRLLRDKKNKPLINRALSGLYSPGSVFKVVIATAALEGHKISAATTYVCNGTFRLGRATFACWKEGGHGPQEVTNALMNSCNVFFYNTGRAAGVDLIETYTKLYGFGKPTGIDLPDEVSGIAPGRAWKRMNRNADWYEGETINYAIGQGYLLVTPIQIMNMMAAVANNGILVKPYIVKRIASTAVASQQRKNLGISDATMKKVRKGLWMVINGEGGTAKRVRVEGVVIAGKTGTAQNPQGSTHAWFAAFAPFDDPKLCVVVFVEHGGHGSDAAALAHDIFLEAKIKGLL